MNVNPIDDIAKVHLYFGYFTCDIIVLESEVEHYDFSENQISISFIITEISQILNFKV